MQRHRIMVVGSNVMTVQRVSRHCLEQGAEVFPYYEIPTLEEITLFNPEVIVFCAAMSESVLRQIEQPYIFWLEDPVASDAAIVSAPIVSHPAELRVHLQKILSM